MPSIIAAICGKKKGRVHPNMVKRTAGQATRVTPLLCVWCYRLSHTPPQLRLPPRYLVYIALRLAQRTCTSDLPSLAQFTLRSRQGTPVSLRG